jgi:hypothetical protein
VIVPEGALELGQPTVQNKARTSDQSPITSEVKLKKNITSEVFSSSIRKQQNVVPHVSCLVLQP